MNKRINLKVYGDVQDVFYRIRTKKSADELGLTGWVRNEPDDTVTVAAEGEESKLKELIDWCYNITNVGVEKIDVGWQEATGKFDGFEIRY
ncbi:MAG: acylphosphatase [Candidatus Portnoybacteria bacterium]|nr:acylphosphatase [Candidatus Portnoybacteria bacterium]